MVTPTFSRAGKRRLDPQNHGQDGLAPDGLHLLAIERGPVRSSRTAVLGGVHVDEARHHLLAVERRQHHGRGFPRAHHKFPGTIGHRRLAMAAALATAYSRLTSSYANVPPAATGKDFRSARASMNHSSR
jgi:hypothetical protein